MKIQVRIKQLSRAINLVLRMQAGNKPDQVPIRLVVRSPDLQIELTRPSSGVVAIDHTDLVFEASACVYIINHEDLVGGQSAIEVDGGALRRALQGLSGETLELDGTKRGWLTLRQVAPAGTTTIVKVAATPIEADNTLIDWSANLLRPQPELGRPLRLVELQAAVRPVWAATLGETALELAPVDPIGPGDHTLRSVTRSLVVEYDGVGVTASAPVLLPRELLRVLMGKTLDDLFALVKTREVGIARRAVAITLHTAEGIPMVDSTFVRYSVIWRVVSERASYAAWVKRLHSYAEPFRAEVQVNVINMLALVEKIDPCRDPNDRTERARVTCYPDDDTLHIQLASSGSLRNVGMTDADVRVSSSVPAFPRGYVHDRIKDPEIYQDRAWSWETEPAELVRVVRMLCEAEPDPALTLGLYFSGGNAPMRMVGANGMAILAGYRR